MAVMDSLFSIAFPVLSVMHDGRKRFVWRILKMSLIVTLPISSTAMLYSYEILSIFGPGYVQASLPLKIILISALTMTFNFAMITLVYSYGNYWQVLYIGLGSSASRILVYFLLVPLYGSIGAATAFTAGSIVAFFFSALVAKKIGMPIFWKEVALIFTIPPTIAFVLDYFQIQYSIGIPAILLLTFILFFALRLLSRSDINDVLNLLPSRIANPLIAILDKL
jgi:O-antigen/teichoic acid export membrane protein